MKVALILVALVSAAVAYEPISIHYHENYGIKQAARIKAAEEALDFDGSSRITGGSPASLGQYSHMGGLVITLSDGRTSVCGSSLISNTRALTAAHCWWDGRSSAQQFVVVLGSVLLFSGGTRITTRDVEIHANYDSGRLVNDIAVIRLTWVNYSATIGNVALPVNDVNTNFVGTTAQAAGFGRIADNAAIATDQFLSHVSLQIVNNFSCRRVYGPLTVVSSTLCTSGANARSTCPGDSGGPLTVARGTGIPVLVGVTSFGHRAGCQLGHPAGFARVTSFLPWIQARL